MCGIFGLFNFGRIIDFKFDNDKIKSSIHTIKHRGPNSSGIVILNNDVCLAHSRLSIIDLGSESNQPFQYNGFILVYNGEIYNYIELRNELISKGYEFTTKGDTEVLLKSYIEWGEDCVSKFNGMWAFALFDENKRILFCSRDRFGEKPFNYALVDGIFIFSSEIKSILSYYPKLATPNYESIAQYVQFGCGAEKEESWFECISRLPPATNMTIDASGINKNRYWRYPIKVNKNISFNEACLQYRKILTDSLNLRMRSDVPIGFTLSSGIDSTSLISLAVNESHTKLISFTAVYNEKFHKSETSLYENVKIIDDSAGVSELSKKLNISSNFCEINYKNFLTELKQIIWHLESGHNSPAIFPLNQVHHSASKNVTVLIEGQGADELLAGYTPSLFCFYLIELLRKLKFKKILKEISIFKKHYSLLYSIKLFIRQLNIPFIHKIYYRSAGFHKLFDEKMKPYLGLFPAHEKNYFSDGLNKWLYRYHSRGLVNLLHYGDAISMAHSIESRLPFLDYRLVEFCFSLPSDYKIKNALGKYMHRKAMENIVNKNILYNPIKIGFDSPLFHVFEKLDKESPVQLLLNPESIARNLFNESEIRRLIYENTHRNSNHSRLLFRLLSVELWFQLFIDKK